MSLNLVNIEDLIKDIDEEFENSDDRNFNFICKDGTEIGTDVYCIRDWWEVYKEVLRKRYTEK